MAATQASRPRRSAIRWVLLVAGSLLVVGLLAILAVAAYALTAPYTSVGRTVRVWRPGPACARTRTG